MSSPAGSADIWECLSAGAEHNVKAKVGEEGCGMTSSGHAVAVVLQVTLQFQVPSQGWHKAEASQCEIIILGPCVWGQEKPCLHCSNYW